MGHISAALWINQHVDDNDDTSSGKSFSTCMHALVWVVYLINIMLL